MPVGEPRPPMTALVRGSHYVAMGSSFGAGPGLTPKATGSPRPAGRSSRNYAHLFAARRGLDLTDVTYSGATTADLLNPNERGVPAQLNAVTEQTALVTITAGGNDLGYLGALTLSSLPRPFRMGRGARRQISESIAADTMDGRLAALEAGLGAIVHRIRERAPEASIVIVDYLTILPLDLTLLSGKPSRDVAQWGLGAASRLSSTFASVAESTGCDFLPVGAASRDHHAWSESPWTRRFHYSLRGGAPYHPNYDGMAAVANLLDHALTADVAAS